MLSANYMHPQQRAIQAYEQATSWLKVRQWVNQLRHEDIAPADYEEDRHGTVILHQYDAGIRPVLLTQIIGSVGRNHDFDRQFRPLDDNTRHRWLSIASAIYAGKEMPPIDVYQLDGQYYVIDGNHRVSVMRAIGQDYIEAHVIVQATQYERDQAPSQNQRTRER